MTGKPCFVRDDCRVCGCKDLVPILDMGKMPLANALPLVKDPNPAKYPLSLWYCPWCFLVQIKENVDPNVLFKDYLYFSSQSETMIESSKKLVHNIIDSYYWGNGSKLVMEAASNDGYLLQHYVKEGIPVIGVDPAENIAQIANDKGIYTIPKFFTYQFAQDYRGAVDVFHANNVLAHVADQNNFVNGIAVVLKHSGVAYIEVPYLGKMIEGGYFDQIYHEHLCYFSLSSLNELFIRQGLDIIDADIIPIHGGSLRIAVCHRGAYNKKAKVGIMLASEAFARKPSYYSTFGERVNRQGMEFWRAMEMLRKHHGYGLTIDGYGAAAKGNQFLNYFKVDQKIITQVYDSTPAKQGRFMSNGQIPIVDPNRLEIHKADYVLILAWNFADEIMNKHKTYLMERAFITAYPEFKFWSNKYPRGTIWD